MTRGGFYKIRPPRHSRDDFFHVGDSHPYGDVIRRLLFVNFYVELFFQRGQEFYLLDRLHPEVTNEVRVVGDALRRRSGVGSRLRAR